MKNRNKINKSGDWGNGDSPHFPSPHFPPHSPFPTHFPQMKNKLISLLLTAVMLLGIIPISSDAAAAEGGYSGNPDIVVVNGELIEPADETEQSAGDEDTPDDADETAAVVSEEDDETETGESAQEGSSGENNDDSEAQTASDADDNDIPPQGDELPLTSGRIIIKLATNLRLFSMPELGIEYSKMRLLNPSRGAVDTDTFTVMNAGGTQNNIYALTVEGPGEDYVENAIAMLNENPAVEYAEPVYEFKLCDTPDDPQYNTQWALQTLNAPEAWEVTTGSRSVVVGIVDSGIEGTHPDLINNLWVNPNPDRNGYENDIHGYDFSDYGGKGGGIPFDNDGHGTHVAGIVGAQGNNGIGVTGINWEVSLAWLGIYAGNGYVDVEAAIEAINYAANHNIPILNNSWGGVSYQQALYDTIAAYPGLFVTAAGNTGSYNDEFPFYPASYDLPNIISVASTDRSGERSEFSNYGYSVHIAAPGSDILSTYIGGTYTGISGTSMASPYIAGLAALIKAENPGFTAAQLHAAILDSARQLPGYAGITRGGFCIADAGAALAGREYITVNTFSQLQSAIASYASATKNMVIALGADFDLTSSLTVPSNPNGKKLTITSQGTTRTLTRRYSDTNANSALFTVPAGADLTLEYVFINGNRGTYTSNAAPIARVSGGILSVKNGAMLYSNRAANGGAVYVSSGIFAMSGGEISSNMATTAGGGVYIGGGEVILGGTAVIRENTRSNGSRNNLYLANENYFSVGAAGSINVPKPLQGMEVWVSTVTPSGVIVNSEAAAEECLSFFADDNSSVVEYENGQLILRSNAEINAFYTQVAAYANATANVTIEVSKNLRLGRVVSIPRNSRGHTLTIKSTDTAGAPFVLSRAFSDPDNESGLFVVNNGGKLITENIIIDGYKNVFTNNKASLIIVKTGGEYTMNSGSVMRNNTAFAGGGVDAYGGVFTLNGGEISGNTAVYGGGACADIGTINMNGGKISNNISQYGNGGGVVIDNGNFTMMGGEIINNTVIGNFGQGGGVILYESTFTMGDGVIGGNTAVSGGGVYIDDGNFTMTGGKITGNVADLSGNLDYVGYGYGGGVYVGSLYGGSSTFTLQSGEISGNTADGGGGVYVAKGTFDMNGGNISGNTAEKFYDSFDTYVRGEGGGVYVYDGVFGLGGGEIDNNTAQRNGGGVFTGNYSGSAITFNMTGGKITGNSAFSHISKHGDLVGGNGGGVYINGFTVFTMEGGEISGNSADITEFTTGNIMGGSGGGIFAADTFINSGINGGTVSGNIARIGGGVSMRGIFEINGGEISGNTATDFGGGIDMGNGTLTISGGNISGNSAGNDGGGVRVGLGTFTMTDGNISGNSAGNDGGGLHLSSCTFTMTGGNISGNSADNNGGGLYVNRYTAATILGGTPVVRDNCREPDTASNLYLISTQYITLGTGSNGAPVPGEGMEVWVSTESTLGTVVNSGATPADTAFFRADAEGRAVECEAGRLIIRIPPYSIIATKPSPFGLLEAPYAHLAEQAVTITSIGTNGAPVTLAQPVSEKYDIGELSTSTLAAYGATATFTIRPKEGLPLGNNDEKIIITGSNGVSAAITVRCTIKPLHTGLYGDVNSDGRVNGTDVQALILWINAGRPEWLIQEEAARVSSADGRPDASDVLALVLWINGGGRPTVGHPGPG